MSGIVLMVVINVPPTAAQHAFADAGCVLTQGESGRVEAIVDGTSLRLDGGRDVRLAGLAAAGRQEADARATLESLALGRTVTLSYGELTADRYGRAVAHVFVAGENVSLQAILLDRGLAMVASSAADRTCIADLLTHEAAARDAGAGLWAGTPVLSAGSPELRTIDGAFVLVDGIVRSVGRRDRTLYLNFGGDWSTDFTVSMTNANAEIIEAEGGPLDALVGRVVLVRGWLTQRDGPWIAVDHAEQIEILDQTP